MCSRFQVKMPATHSSGLSSRTGLDPFTARTPPAWAHRHMLAWLSPWGSRGGEGVAQIPVGGWNKEEDQECSCQEPFQWARPSWEEGSGRR